MLTSIFILCFHFYFISGETLDGTSTEFLKEYIEVTKLNKIMVIKEQNDGENRSLVHNLVKELHMMNIFVTMVDYPLREKLRSSDEKLLFIISISHLSLKSILQELGEDLSSSQATWLIKAKEEDLQHLKLSFNSQCFSFQEEDKRLVITEHYNIGQSRQITREVGHWTRSGLVMSDVPWLTRRKDLQGHKFRAETMPEIPFSTWDVDNKKIGAVIGELWHQIFEKTLNFTTDISQPPDMKWGSPNEDGTWDGLVGGLLENRSHIILAALYRTVARSFVIDFSSTFGEARTRMFIKYPEREDNWTPFLEPFHPFVWFCLFLILFTLIAVLVASYTFGTENFINHGSFTISNTPIIVWGSLLSQGSHLDPKSCATKTIFLISLLVGVLAVASFNATLTSYLTVNKVRLPFTTLAGVIGSGYKVGGVGAIFDDFLHAPPGSVKRAIGDEIIRKYPDTKIETYEEGRVKMLNEKFGYITDFNHMITRNKDNCLFIDIPQDVSTFQVGLGFPKHFEYRKLFNQAIQKNSENGGIDRVMRKWTAKLRSNCIGNIPLGMENVISAFAMICGGFSLSLVVFCFEMGRVRVGRRKMIIRAMWS